MIQEVQSQEKRQRSPLVGFFENFKISKKIFFNTLNKMSSESLMKYLNLRKSYIIYLAYKFKHDVLLDLVPFVQF